MTTGPVRLLLPLPHAPIGSRCTGTTDLPLQKTDSQKGAECPGN
jgi:hypothetical protein